jgi:SAM-dependent methyltransferase
LSEPRPVIKTILHADAGKLAQSIRSAADSVKIEAELRIEIEHLFRDFFKKLGIEYAPHHDRTIITGKPDTMYGAVIIEYKAPKSFAGRTTSPKFQEALSQAEEDIKQLSKAAQEKYSKYVGIVLDGHWIAFVRWRRDQWNVSPIYEVNADSVLQLVEYLRGLSKKPLTAESLVESLGAGTPIAKQCIEVLWTKLVKTKKKAIIVRFGQWRRVFSQICAYDFTTPRFDVKQLARTYGVRAAKSDLASLLFAIHTYYALVVKLLAAEVLVLQSEFLLQSYLENLSPLPTRDLRNELENLENGGIFAKLGLRNFLEGDVYSWYLYAWDRGVESVVRDTIKALNSFEPATARLEPEEVRDLLKKLYQYLLPKKIRHDLGEYYTPDWLADLVLNELDYHGDPDHRILDPACGSGTFLLLAINRIKQWGNERLIPPEELLNKILKNVVGFDLNPLAVIASRTNYIMALGDLLRHRTSDINIPVYLSDSILTPKPSEIFGETYVVRTVVGTFEVPNLEEQELGKSLDILEQCVTASATKENFKDRIEREITSVTSSQRQHLVNIFTKMKKLEKEGANKYWCRMIKNLFAPMFAGSFDIVVGNPPWVNWANLPDDYRQITRSEFDRYGLIPHEAKVGAVKTDISILFTYVALDRYLTDTGALGFVITQSVFKSKSAEGFRSFEIKTHEKPVSVKVIKVHDMVDIRPFEDAQNRTSVLVAAKGQATLYPVPYVLWRKSAALTPETSLEVVFENSKRHELVALPIGNDPTSPWLCGTPEATKAVEKIVATGRWRARSGIDTGGGNGVYWVRVLEKTSTNELLVENIPEESKKSVPKIRTAVESSLVYPLCRGADVDRWLVKNAEYIIAPHDASTGMQAINENTMRVKFPKTYDYFLKLKNVIKARRTLKIFGGSTEYWYSLFKIGKYTFQPFKVVWREITSDFVAAVLSPRTDPYVGMKTILPDHKLMMVPCDTETQAHYLCAILNSSIVRFLVKSYTVETQISTHVLEYVPIPTFDLNNQIHLKLAAASKEAHDLATAGTLDRLRSLEEEIDNTVACDVYGLNSDDLEATRLSLRILMGATNSD